LGDDITILRRCWVVGISGLSALAHFTIVRFQERLISQTVVLLYARTLYSQISEFVIDPLRVRFEDRILEKL
jgi:hypothetical protein